MDDRDEDVSDELLELSLDLAHRDIASSTTAAIAVKRPPARDESEEDEEDVMETGLGGLGGGSPRKISEPSSASSSEGSKGRKLSTDGCRSHAWCSGGTLLSISVDAMVLEEAAAWVYSEGKSIASRQYEPAYNHRAMRWLKREKKMISWVFVRFRAVTFWPFGICASFDRLCAIMPRRPRPADRPPPKSMTASTSRMAAPKPSKPPQKIIRKVETQPEPDSSEATTSDEDSDNESDTLLSNEDVGSIASGSDPGIEEDIDVDAPRVAQWEPDEFEVDGVMEDSNSSEDEVEPEEKTAGPSQVQLVCLINCCLDSLGVLL